jgi:hypothetical protein
VRAVNAAREALRTAPRDERLVADKIATVGNLSRGRGPSWRRVARTASSQTCTRTRSTRRGARTTKRSTIGLSIAAT